VDKKKRQFSNKKRLKEALFRELRMWLRGRVQSTCMLLSRHEAPKGLIPSTGKKKEKKNPLI
jgi:hypothetical protein